MILLARMEKYDALRGPENHRQLIECAVNVLVTPEDFTRSAILSLDVGRSIDVLTYMGFDTLPLA